MDEQQPQKVKAIDDQQAAGAGGKRPYHTPTLTKLGSVEQVTQGTHILPIRDDGVLSV